jgi:2,4-dichlorophenol 6-monooxygenase
MPVSTTPIDVPVLIVGGGPVGLLGAVLLARRGVHSLLAEKHLQRLEAPKAHALNPRSLEICAAAGLPMDALHALATPAHEGATVRMVTSLVGAEIGSLPYERQDAAVRRITPWPLINIAQPRFEQVVEQVALGAPAADIRRGMEWTRCTQTNEGVVSVLQDRRGGAELTVRSRYMIAADGAGSTIRDHLGIAMEGPEALQSNMMVHFEADLRSLVATRPAILYFLFGPGANGVLIAYDIGKTWVLMHRCAPDSRVQDFDTTTCLRLVRQAIGTDAVDVQIKGVRPWVMSAQVATRYRHGNVFLVGDAGHRFPPSGGLGLNTGVADIDNLTWKIAALEAGHAGPGLLDSYEVERKGIAETNMRQSLANALRMRSLAEALGYGPDGTVDAQTFATRLADPASRAQVADALAGQKDHFDSLRLQLGYCYGDTSHADEDLPISEFRPQAVAGARLPHIPLHDGRSSLDLLAPQAFTLMAGAAGTAWRQAESSWPVPVTLRLQGVDFACTADFAAAMGLGPDGAILVRPDGHILALASSADAKATRHLVDALANYLAITAIPAGSGQTTPRDAIS